jgi:hypothetical protein
MLLTADADDVRQLKIKREIEMGTNPPESPLFLVSHRLAGHSLAITDDALYVAYLRNTPVSSALRL